MTPYTGNVYRGTNICVYVCECIHVSSSLLDDSLF